DPSVIGKHFVADLPIVGDAVAMARQLLPTGNDVNNRRRGAWHQELRNIYDAIAQWPDVITHGDALNFTGVVKQLAQLAPANATITLDAGTFGAPFYRHFRFSSSQRLLAPISGAMGFGVPAAVAAQMRCPDRRVICVVGDGGFLMTGNELITAVQRRLPILFILSNNHGYGSIRIHQDREYPGRHAGTSLFNPNFARMVEA